MSPLLPGLEVEAGGEDDVPLEELDGLAELVLQLRVPDVLARLGGGNLH